MLDMASLNGMLPSSSVILFLIVILNYIHCDSQLNFKLPRLQQSFMRTLRNNYTTSKTCVHDIPTQLPFNDEPEYIHCFEETARSQSSRHPDQDLRTNQVITKYGYYLITYNATTKDGYILTIFRISGSPMVPPRIGKPAVLLYHGMATASDMWIVQSEEKKNLAMKLVNAGYDVWLVNSRGTDFSRGHMKLNPNLDIKYWEFSYHEMGIYDFPAVVELMLSETGNEKIFLICHSMGCAVYGVALAELPQLNSKIEAGILLAPAIFISHTYCPLRAISVLLEIGPYLQRTIRFAVRGRFEVGTRLQNLVQSRLCTPTALRCGVCGLSLFFTYGYDAPQMEYANIPNILSKFSNTESFNSLLHLGQNYKSCMFRKFDYGIRENLLKYGEKQPPSYNLSNIRVPTYIYYADADNFVPPVDVNTLRKALPVETVKSLKRVQWRLFNHIDFMIAKDADILVYNDVLDVLSKYTNIGG